MKWIGECIKAKKFIFKKIWEIKKAIISGFWNVMIDIIMFPCRKLGIDKAYRPLWRAKVNVWNNLSSCRRKTPDTTHDTHVVTRARGARDFRLDPLFPLAVPPACLSLRCLR